MTTFKSDHNNSGLPSSTQRSQQKYSSKSTTKPETFSHTTPKKSKANLFQCKQCPQSFIQESILKKHFMKFHIEEKDKPFECEICLKENKCKKFIDKQALKSHIKNIHESVRFKCEHCGKKLCSEDSRKLHYQNMHSGNQIKCDYCPKEFENKRLFRVHLFAKHKDVAEECKNRQSHKCELCSKAFNSSRGLINHVVTVHVVDKPFECQYCSKGFMKETELKTHLKHHDDTANYLCDVCPNRFKIKKELVHHLKVKHSKYFYCYKCLNSFATQTEFDQHLKTVEEASESASNEFISKFVCEICHASFSSQCYVNIHNKSHVKEDTTEPTENKQSTDSNIENQTNDQLQCDLCSKTFDRSWNLILHNRYAHPNISEWQCKICLKMFKKRKWLLKHKRSVHTSGTVRPYACDVCEKSFKYPKNLSVHKEIHLPKGQRRKTMRFKCEICCKLFHTSYLLKTHMANYHDGERPFKCDKCSKSWATKGELQVHVVAHSTVKPFKCDFCSGLFKRQHSLKNHYLRFHPNTTNPQSSKSKPVNGDTTVFACTICSFQTEEDKCVAIHYSQHSLPRVTIFPLEKKNNPDPSRNYCRRVIQKRYNCKQCSKLFAFPHSLKKHLLTHSSENPNICVNCLRPFRSPYYLKRHTKSCHK